MTLEQVVQVLVDSGLTGGVLTVLENKSENLVEVRSRFVPLNSENPVLVFRVSDFDEEVKEGGSGSTSLRGVSEKLRVRVWDWLLENSPRESVIREVHVKIRKSYPYEGKTRTALLALEELRGLVSQE